MAWALRDRWKALGALGAALGLSAALPAMAHGQGQPQPQPARPAEPRAMIVLDGSGSMWGKLGKDVKLNAARDAIKQAVPKSRADIGLVSYSHKRADCTDSEVVVPPGKPDYARFAGFLDKFNPKGKGPIGGALEAAAEALEEGQRGTIIVLADNADNCKVDTCAAIRDIKQAKPRLTAHVIALGVPKEEQPQLACIATETGGRIFRLESGSDIGAALEETLALAAGPARQPGAQAAAAPAAAPAPAPAPRKDAAPSGPPGLRLSAVLRSGGEPIAAGVRWRVLPGGADPKSDAARALYDSDDANPTLALKPGRYLVEARYGLVEARQMVEVAEKGPTPADVVLNAGVIRVRSAGAPAGSVRERAFYTLYRSANQPSERPVALVMSNDAAPVYSVPAGTYTVVAQHGLSRIERAVAIGPGTIADVELPLYLSELKLVATAAEGSPPLERMFWLVYEDDPEAPEGVREVARSGAREPELTLPAGTYHVVARHGAAEARERLSLKPGTRIVRTLVMGSGRVTLAARLTGRGQLDPELVSFRIERLGGAAPRPGQKPEAREIARASLADPTVVLNAGRYRIESHYGPANARASRELEIKPGATHTLTLEHEAGLAKLRLVDAARGQPVADVFWEVVDSGGRTVWSTGQSTPAVPLAAGRYTVRAEHRDQRHEQSLQLASGDERTLELVAR